MNNAEFYKRMDKFGHRCVLCSASAVTLHEVIPKSRAPKTWDRFENQVALCNECHETIHRKGALNFVEELRIARQRALGLIE